MTLFDIFENRPVISGEPLSRVQEESDIKGSPTRKGFENNDDSNDVDVILDSDPIELDIELKSDPIEADSEETDMVNTRSAEKPRTAWELIGQRCEQDVYEKLIKKGPSKIYGALSKAQQNKISKIIQNNIKALAEQKSGAVSGGVSKPGPKFSKKIIPVDEVRQCNHCSGVFNKLGKLKKHTLTHFRKAELLKKLPPGKPYLCPKRFCSKRFLMKINLMRHWAFEHYSAKHDLKDNLLVKESETSNLLCQWYDVSVNSEESKKKHNQNNSDKLRLTYGRPLYGDDDAKMRDNYKLSRAEALEPQHQNILNRIENRFNDNKDDNSIKDLHILNEEEKEELNDPTYGKKPVSNKKVKVSSFMAAELERYGVMDNLNVEVAKPFPSNVFKAGPASKKGKSTDMEIQLQNVYNKISNNDQNVKLVNKRPPAKDMNFESPVKTSHEKSRPRPGPASSKSNSFITPTKPGPASSKASDTVRPKPGPASKKFSPPKKKVDVIDTFDVEDDDDDIVMVKDSNNNELQSKSEDDTNETLILRSKPGPASSKSTVTNKKNRPGPASSKRKL